jgi:hypothetical protein
LENYMLFCKEWNGPGTMCSPAATWETWMVSPTQMHNVLCRLWQ